ncbi:MAG: hypothetical protein NC930_07960, partial [Candidatus Omnitrophica bacterium]|nr:hypothetical protein [Candidatus Omnitrophota bacterium]
MVQYRRVISDPSSIVKEDTFSGRIEKIFLNRRSATRIPLNVPVSYKLVSRNPFEAWRKGRSADFSCKGIRLVTKKPIPVGNRICLVLKVPGMSKMMRV